MGVTSCPILRIVSRLRLLACHWFHSSDQFWDVRTGQAEGPFYRTPSCPTERHCRWAKASIPMCLSGLNMRLRIIWRISCQITPINGSSALYVIELGCRDMHEAAQFEFSMGALRIIIDAKCFSHKLREFQYRVLSDKNWTVEIDCGWVFV